MPLSEKVRIDKGGIHGWSWFANEDIKEGDLLWWYGDYGVNQKFVVRYPIKEVQNWPTEKREKFLALAYQVDDETFDGFPPDQEIPFEVIKENYVNHTCDGNCWYSGNLKLVAMRDIKKGEEIAYDYALTESHPSFLIEKCLCKTAKCRGTITGNDWKKKELQDLYGDHFLPYVLEKVNQLKLARTEHRGLLKHVVCVGFKKDSPVDEIIRRFETMAKDIPVIAAFEHGANVTVEPFSDGYHHCFTVTFKAAKDREEYLVHSKHTEFVKYALPHLDKTFVIDYWTQ